MQIIPTEDSKAFIEIIVEPYHPEIHMDTSSCGVQLNIDEVKRVIFELQLGLATLEGRK